MRVGLCGQVRRVWAPRGVKVRQRVQMTRAWRYLALAVDGRRGTLRWCWIANMKGPTIAEAVQAWQAPGPEGGGWGGGRGARAPQGRPGGGAPLGPPPPGARLGPGRAGVGGTRGGGGGDG